MPPTKLKHPTEKPVDLLRALITSVTKPDAVVLDCFMGSGSTGEATLKSQRQFIGIELDKNYFDIAKERLSKWEGQKTIFS